MSNLIQLYVHANTISLIVDEILDSAAHSTKTVMTNCPRTIYEDEHFYDQLWHALMQY